MNDLTVNTFDVASGAALAACVPLSTVTGDDLDAFEHARTELERDRRTYLGGGSAPLVLVTLA